MTLEGFIKYPTIPLLGLAVTCGVTPLIMRLAVRLGMVDQPDERRIHRQPIPRAGGLAVFLGFHAACALTLFWPWGEFLTAMGPTWWLRFTALSGLLVIVGLIDDRWGLKPRLKLGGQVLVALSAFLVGMNFERLGGYELPWFLDLIITVLWILALVNAFNLIDGMDGLATGLGGIAAMGLAGSFLLADQPGDCLVLLGLMGACLGFLRYNFHPARVFLGDTGSMFIGFALAAISLQTSTKSTVAAVLVVPFLAVGVPVFDAFLAVWRRSARRALQLLRGQVQTEAKVKLSGADLDHVHHRLLRTGWSQRQAAMLLYAASLTLVVVGLTAVALRSLAIGIYMIAFLAASYVLVRHVVHVELWDSATALAKGLERPPRRSLVVPMYMVVDTLVLFVAHVLAYVIAVGRTDWEAIRYDAFSQSVFYVGIPFITLVVSQTYRRVWSRARVIDFVYLSVVTTGGVFLGVGVSSLYYGSGTLDHILVGLTTLVLSLPGLVGVRLIRRLANEALVSMERWYQVDERQERLLVYGAGRLGMLFVREEGLRMLDATRQYRIMGFLDDDSNLHGQLVAGLPVFGGIEKLDEILKQTGARLVVITEDLEPQTLERLRWLRAKGGVKIARWWVTLEPAGVR